MVNDGRKLLIELGAMIDKGKAPLLERMNSSATQEGDQHPNISAKSTTNKGELQGSSLTKIGQQLAKMPIDPRLARMILGGAHFGVLNEVLIIVAALAVQDPRERPADKQMQADQKHASVP